MIGLFHIFSLLFPPFSMSLPEISQLYYRHIRGLMGHYQLEIRTKELSPNPFSGQYQNISLRRLLLEAGILLTSSIHIWDQYPWWYPSAWFTLFRYGCLFRHDDSRLCLDDDVNRLDIRIRQILSEEIGIGFCGYMLREHFGVIHIADAEPLIGTLLMRHDPTPCIRPDYFCRTNLRQTMVAEAKGTIGDMRSLNPKMRQGKRQVSAVRPTDTPANGGLVIGLALATHRDDRDSIGAIYDPLAENAVTLEINPEHIVRLAYAKAFSFMGMPSRGQHLLKDLKEIQPIREREREPEPVLPLTIREQEYIFPKWIKEFYEEFYKQRGPEKVKIRLGMHKSVYDALTSPERGLEQRILNALSNVKPYEDENNILLNNGIFFSLVWEGNR